MVYPEFHKLKKQMDDLFNDYMAARRVWAELKEQEISLEDALSALETIYMKGGRGG